MFGKNRGSSVLSRGSAGVPLPRTYAFPEDGGGDYTKHRFCD